MCVHLNFPGEEQLKKNLARNRQKEIFLFMCLKVFFFGAKQDALESLGSTLNMMFMQLGVQEFFVRYPKDNAIFQALTNFYKKHASLPIIAEKNIIGLFRKCMI